MEIKCSGLKCPVQYDKINVKECNITGTCQYFTPKTTICTFCKTFPATLEIHGIPCCGSCKMSIDLADQFSKLRLEINSGFKRLEGEILGKR